MYINKGIINIRRAHVSAKSEASRLYADRIQLTSGANWEHKKHKEETQKTHTYKGFPCASSVPDPLA